MMLDGTFNYLKLFTDLLPNDTIGWGYTAILIFWLYTFYKKGISGISNEVKISFLICIFYLLAIFLKTENHIFRGHSYYMFGLMPYISIIVASSLHDIGEKWDINPRKWSKAIIVIGLITLIGREGHSYRVDPYPYSALVAKKDIDSVIPASELIAVNEAGPIKLYYFHRKGWGLKTTKMLDKSYVEELKSKGLKYMVFWREKDLSEHQVREALHPKEVWYFKGNELLVVAL